MIYGIGTDVVYMTRIDKLLASYGDKFIERILSQEEIKVYRDKGCKAFLARRFAGKEALFKALGTGIGKPLRFNDITIRNNDLGKPEVEIAHRGNSFELTSGKNIHISLSDDEPVVVAFVIISSIIS